MDFNNVNKIKAAGFVGFKKMSELFLDTSLVPRSKGVYLILNLDSKPPQFLAVGSGPSLYKKRINPNVSISELKLNWIEKTIVIYIGKAGKIGSKATLQSRLRQYIRFGQGKDVGHYGGRLIWQLKNSDNLVVCWKELPTEDPRTFELSLITEFVSTFSSRPFANLCY
jgi:hypothetical protein